MAAATPRSHLTRDPPTGGRGSPGPAANRLPAPPMLIHVYMQRTYIYGRGYAAPAAPKAGTPTPAGTAASPPGWPYHALLSWRTGPPHSTRIAIAHRSAPAAHRSQTAAPSSRCRRASRRTRERSIAATVRPWSVVAPRHAPPPCRPAQPPSLSQHRPASIAHPLRPASASCPPSQLCGVRSRRRAPRHACRAALLARRLASLDLHRHRSSLSTPLADRHTLQPLPSRKPPDTRAQHRGRAEAPLARAATPLAASPCSTSAPSSGLANARLLESTPPTASLPAATQPLPRTRSCLQPEAFAAACTNRSTVMTIGPARSTERERAHLSVTLVTELTGPLSYFSNQGS